MSLRASQCSLALGPSDRVICAGAITHRVAENRSMKRFVTFDALHTLITPRKPIHIQYAEVFSPYLGTLPPDAIARSFKLGVPFSLQFST